MAYCRAAAERSSPGMALMKRLAREGLPRDLAQGLAPEASAVVPALLPLDVDEGLAAFGLRRMPVFGSAASGGKTGRGRLRQAGFVQHLGGMFAQPRREPTDCPR